MRVHDKREPVTWVAALVIVQHKLDAGNQANACHSLNRDPAFRRIFPRMNRAAFWALAQFLVGVEPLVEWRKVLDDLRRAACLRLRVRLILPLDAAANAAHGEAA